MEDKQIPMIVHEAQQARNERVIKRLILALIIITALLFASNVMWLYAWMQYDYTSTSQEYQVDLSTKGGGNANYIGQNGDILNGKGESNEKNENTQ